MRPIARYILKLKDNIKTDLEETVSDTELNGLRIGSSS
jgi:hypothetical protein